MGNLTPSLPILSKCRPNLEFTKAERYDIYNKMCLLTTTTKKFFFWLWIDWLPWISARTNVLCQSRRRTRHGMFHSSRSIFNWRICVCLAFEIRRCNVHHMFVRFFFFLILFSILIADALLFLFPAMPILCQNSPRQQLASLLSLSWSTLCTLSFFFPLDKQVSLLTICVCVFVCMLGSGQGGYTCVTAWNKTIAQHVSLEAPTFRDVDTRQETQHHVQPHIGAAATLAVSPMSLGTNPSTKSALPVLSSLPSNTMRFVDSWRVIPLSGSFDVSFSLSNDRSVWHLCVLVSFACFLCHFVAQVVMEYNTSGTSYITIDVIGADTSSQAGTWYGKGLLKIDSAQSGTSTVTCVIINPIPSSGIAMTLR